jgi:hypothetical protein
MAKEARQEDTPNVAEPMALAQRWHGIMMMMMILGIAKPSHECASSKVMVMYLLDFSESTPHLSGGLDRRIF